MELDEKRNILILEISTAFGFAEKNKTEGELKRPVKVKETEILL